MSDERISLYDLLNVSIGTPQVGAVNFGALHALLHAVLEQLDIQQVKTRWRSAAPGDRRPDAVAAEEDLQAGEGPGGGRGSNGGREDRGGTEQQERNEAAPSPTSSSSRARRSSLLPGVPEEEDVPEVRRLLTVIPSSQPQEPNKNRLQAMVNHHMKDTNPWNVFIKMF